jgi:hypothetical protein
MSLTTSEMSPADFAAINGNNNNGGWGFGGDGWWIIVLLLLFGNGGWGGFGGFGGDFGMMPYFYNTQTQNDVNRGFDNAALAGTLNGIQSAVTSGFGDVALAQCNNTTTLLQSLNGLAMGLQSCCCDNKAGIADLKYTIATENCADRATVNEGVRDIIASNTANTQAILDKLCSQEIEAKNDQISQLRQELLYSRGQASQIAQTEQITNDIYNRLSNCPVPSTPVYGRQPIFTCNNNGCGCGANF